MRLLLNENIPRSVVLELRADGNDVRSVIEIMPGADDATILDGAIRIEIGHHTR
jgi:hypothetical protein